jgi:pimeloyl-ACP methyl ester carboxylesterase
VGVTELCVIHPGSLSGLCWKRLAKHLPAGTSLRVLELEAINAYWEQETSLTVDVLADRLKLTLDPRMDRVLCGWGVGGVVAAALATRVPQHTLRSVVVLDGPAPGMERPGVPELLRSYAMLVGARRGRAFNLDPQWRSEGLEPALESLREAASRAGGMRDGATTDILRRGYHQHARDRLRDFRLIRTYEPTGVPVTVVKPAGSLLPEKHALGWELCGPVELLASGGDHYTMLTEPAPVVNLALLLSRWLGTPSMSVAA